MRERDYFAGESGTRIGVEGDINRGLSDFDARRGFEWLKSGDLRRRANAGLNKGEARNALARAVFFYRLGEMRDRSFESQAYRASGLNFLVAAIILWNTVYLERAFAELRRQGRDVRLELAKHVAPLGWTGDYVWSSTDLPADGSFRPLRRKESMLAA